MLKKKELAALLYSRGYAKVKLYESSRTTADQRLLSEAREDFRACVKADGEHHNARRALEKMQKRRGPFSRQVLTELVGPWMTAGLSLCIFVIAQLAFFSTYLKPGQEPSPATGSVVSAVNKEAVTATARVAGLEALSIAPAEAAPDTRSREASKDKGQAGASTEAKAPRKGMIGEGMYALLSFGSLLFLIAGFYLPQILKLKVAGIELEKSVVDQIAAPTALGIRK